MGETVLVSNPTKKTLSIPSRHFFQNSTGTLKGLPGVASLVHTPCSLFFGYSKTGASGRLVSCPAHVHLLMTNSLVSKAEFSWAYIFPKLASSSTINMLTTHSVAFPALYSLLEAV